MSQKAQHSHHYRRVPALLRQIREAAGMTQREIGKKLTKPQSWIYNCETANRRVDATEFIAWCRACNADPKKEFEKLL